MMKEERLSLICGKTETLANVWVDVITGKANDKVELGGQE